MKDNTSIILYHPKNIFLTKSKRFNKLRILSIFLKYQNKHIPLAKLCKFGQIKIIRNIYLLGRVENIANGFIGRARDLEFLEVGAILEKQNDISYSYLKWDE